MHQMLSSVKFISRTTYKKPPKTIQVFGGFSLGICKARRLHDEVHRLRLPCYVLRSYAAFSLYFCIFEEMPNARAVRRVLHFAKGVYDGWLCLAGTRAKYASPFCVMQQGKTGGASETDETFATTTAA